MTPDQVTDIEKLKIRAEAFEDAAREIEGAANWECECCGHDTPIEDIAALLVTRANLIRAEIRRAERQKTERASVNV